jgi:hypothetical protein
MHSGIDPGSLGLGPEYTWIRDGQTMKLPGVQTPPFATRSSCQNLGLQKPLQPGPKSHGRLPGLQDIRLGQGGCIFGRGDGHGDALLLGFPRRDLQSISQDIPEVLRKVILPCPEKILQMLQSVFPEFTGLIGSLIS